METTILDWDVPMRNSCFNHMKKVYPQSWSIFIWDFPRIFPETNHWDDPPSQGTSYDSARLRQRTTVQRCRSKQAATVKPWCWVQRHGHLGTGDWKSFSGRKNQQVKGFWTDLIPEYLVGSCFAGIKFWCRWFFGDDTEVTSKIQWSSSPSI